MYVQLLWQSGFTIEWIFIFYFCIYLISIYIGKIVLECTLIIRFYLKAKISISVSEFFFWFFKSQKHEIIGPRLPTEC